MAQKQASPSSKPPQFWGLGKKKLPKKMAQRKKTSVSPPQGRLQQKGGAKDNLRWSQSLNSIVEEFKSLPKDKGSFTCETHF